MDGTKLLNTFLSQAWSSIISITILHILLLASIVKRFPDSEIESYPAPKQRHFTDFDLCIWFIIRNGNSCTFITEFDLGNAIPFYHGLRTPNEAFFHQNPTLFGLDRQFGQKMFRVFGVFSTNLSAPLLVLWVPCPCVPLINHYF